MTIHELNHLPPHQLKEALFRCCGSHNWVNKMTGVFPVEDYVDLTEDAEEKWYQCNEADWLEAFSHHPMIGDVSSLREKYGDTAEWAAGEQAGAGEAPQNLLDRLAEVNRLYKEKFGFIFIVCATGKSAGEMLQMLEERLQNDRATEIKIAADQQMQITRLRLEKILD